MKFTKKIALRFVFAWFLIGGLGHFIVPDFFLSITPPWVPFPLAVVYISGVFELLGAIGIMIRKYRSLAGIGLFLLTLAVTPANIYMWQNPELFAYVPEPLLTVRLFIQVFLLWCIWWGVINYAKSNESKNI